MGVAISPVLVHLLRLNEGNPAATELGKMGSLRVVIQNYNNRQEGVDLFHMSSQPLLYIMHIYDYMYICK